MTAQQMSSHPKSIKWGEENNKNLSIKVKEREQCNKTANTDSADWVHVSGKYWAVFVW